MIDEVKQLTLGELISKLRELDGGKEIRFDFAYFRPDDFASYRGYYNQLAIGYDQGKDIYVCQLLEECLQCLGKTFEGYKGGSYTMTAETPLWVANYGEATGTAIVDVRDDGWIATLITASID